MISGKRSFVPRQRHQVQASEPYLRDHEIFAVAQPISGSISRLAGLFLIVTAVSARTIMVQIRQVCARQSGQNSSGSRVHDVSALLIWMALGSRRTAFSYTVIVEKYDPWGQLPIQGLDTTWPSV